MAIYAIGDVQGCFDELQALLRVTGYRRGRDRLDDRHARSAQAGEHLELGAGARRVEVAVAQQPAEQPAAAVGPHDDFVRPELQPPDTAAPLGAGHRRERAPQPLEVERAQVGADPFDAARSTLLHERSEPGHARMVSPRSVAAPRSAGTRALDGERCTR